MALRPCPHDSEPAWLAVPSPYDSFIRDILPDDACASAWRFDTSPLEGCLTGTLVCDRQPIERAALLSYMFPVVDLCFPSSTCLFVGTYAVTRKLSRFLL